MKNQNSAHLGGPAIHAFAMVAITVATGLLAPSASAEPPDRAAFEAAAKACGLPKRGEGRPTAEQETCMAKAGFSRPKGPPRGDRRESHRPPAPPEGESTSGGSRGSGTAQ